MDWFTLPSFTIVTAPPRAGKTHLTSYLLMHLYEQKKYDYAYVFSPTGRSSFDFMPEQFVFPKFEESKLVQIMQVAKQCMKHQKAGGPRAPRILLVFDDCLGAVHWQKPLMEQLVSTYRHYNISMLINTQYITKMPTTFREMATYIFILRQNTDLAFKHLFDCCMGRTLFKKQDVWTEFVNNSTLNRGILVCKMESAISKAERFLIFRAPADLPKSSINFEQ